MSDRRSSALTKLRGARARSTYAQVVATVRGLGRPEIKSVDSAFVFITCAVAPTTQGTALNLIQEGAGMWNRVGRKIALKSLNLTGYITSVAPNPSNLAQEKIRYIIYYDKQPNGTNATWADIIKAYDQTGASSSTVHDGVNLDNRDRFVILRDRHIQLPSVNSTGFQISIPYGTSAGSVGSGGSDAGCVVKEFVKLKGIETQFSGTANPLTISSITTGSLGIVAQGNVGNQWLVGFKSRVRYTDN